MPAQRRISDAVRLLVSVRAGGCCELCGQYLFEGPLTAQQIALGELAHIVGQSDAARSPRGQVEMSPEDRDSSENLMLLCRDEHAEIDRTGSLDVVTIDFLRATKSAHEECIRRLVSIERDHKTAVLRLIGNVQGEAVQITRQAANAAVLSSGRYAEYVLSYDQQGVEIDLRGIPGEVEGSAEYWPAARRKIDEETTRLADGVRLDAIAHLSVFAFARLPLLVYLGSKLDDTYGVDIYQRQREADGWAWADAPAASFRVARPENLGPEVVLVMNVSGTIDPGQLPATLINLPRITLTVHGAPPGVDAIGSRGSLAAFERAVRDLLAELEGPTKVVQRVHVIAAVPVSAAVALGRAHNGPVHPVLTIYHRASNTYLPALEIR